MRIGEASRILQALVAEPEEVQADLVAADDLLVGVGPPTAVGRLSGPRRFAVVAVDGAVALAEKHIGEGRVLVLTSTLDTFWNDLARQPVFLPFMHQMMKYAAGCTEAAAWHTVGDVADLDAYIEMMSDERERAGERDYDLVVSAPSE